MHSPSRPVAVKDQQGWKVPPCISNWKNPKGYNIPLEKRLGVCKKFRLMIILQALNVAERKAREAVAMRSKLQKEILMKEKDRREQELRALAQKARSEGSGRAPPPSFIITAESNTMDGDEMKLDNQTMIESKRENETREERLVREKVRGERRTERKRERRLEAKDVAMGKKSKITRDRDRDISEKVALRMANTGAGCGGEVMYDQRLFNQEKGMDSGFAADDQYNVYGKKLCTAKSTFDSIYKPKKDTDTNMYGGEDEQLDRVLKTDRFRPDKGFAGANETAGPRENPIEFEKEPDPFDLDHFWTKEGFAFAHCTTCKAPYHLRVYGAADRKWRTLKFHFFVTRDIVFTFAAVQLVIASLAYLAYFTDSYQQFGLHSSWGFTGGLSFYYICGNSQDKIIYLNVCVWIDCYSFQPISVYYHTTHSDGWEWTCTPSSFIITAESNMMDGDEMKLDDQTMIESKRENETREERLVREKVRGERRTERKRERRLEAKDVAMGKKSKITRDRDRDISEKVVLGMAKHWSRAWGRGNI
ncbi:hypothetical protein IFM89_023866 [Coptis chinensis]|uniref:SKI-interacting protein SKIP SNW domain-containing protein n=1 Tax=Coptis chinensis TaxID=261450 RepID=A0A835LJC4_9MAGN|nr:hypothetical protein IFM89_023866 [Coptis chinensis]